MKRWLGSIHGLVLGVLFFLPWMTVSCPGPQGRRPNENQVSASGFTLSVSPGDLPIPHKPDTPDPTPSGRKFVLEAPHPTYLLILLLSLGLLATAWVKPQKSPAFRGLLQMLWVAGCLTLALGSWGYHQRFKGDPFGYHLKWEPAFYATLAALPFAVIWLLPARRDESGNSED